MLLRLFVIAALLLIVWGLGFSTFLEHTKTEEKHTPLPVVEPTIQWCGYWISNARGYDISLMSNDREPRGCYPSLSFYADGYYSVQYDVFNEDGERVTDGFLANKILQHRNSEEDRLSWLSLVEPPVFGEFTYEEWCRSSTVENRSYAPCSDEDTERFYKPLHYGAEIPEGFDPEDPSCRKWQSNRRNLLSCPAAEKETML